MGCYGVVIVKAFVDRILDIRWRTRGHQKKSDGKQKLIIGPGMQEPKPKPLNPQNAAYVDLSRVIFFPYREKKQTLLYKITIIIIFFQKYNIYKRNNTCNN